MPSLFKLGSAIVGLALLYQEVAAQSGSGKTTRYWDCCKPSCAWSKKATVSHPVTTCDKNNNPLSNYDTKSACDSGGTAYTCANNAPIVVNDNLAYGFAAVNIAGSNEAGWCCQCYELTFTSGPVQGKKWVVQATNTGGDLGSNQFDLLIPGGGVGIFNGCTSQYGSWNGGAQYGGVSSESQCDSLPTAAMQSGCKFRFQWFKGADNPSVSWKAVGCPSQLTSISGCVRNGDAGYTPSEGGSNPATTTTAGGSTQTGGGGGTVAQYGQCGGANYSGATECVAGTTCTKVNDYYYQCI